MKKLSFLLFLTLIFSYVNMGAYAQDISVSAKAAVLVIADTGEVIYEKNAYEKLPMASTTKIMTSLLALESGERRKTIKVTDEMVAVEGTSMGLKADDTVSVENLVYGMLLQSGNDAANVTAAVLSKGKSFSDMMNE
ncbi:MAG: D-alanyl-D-alanine carboxypeptidase, partial [Clostridia bacterium]|nr:D-alanyl-D-alanine carboxypeptidase [Clostridia bacterium]